MPEPINTQTATTTSTNGTTVQATVTPGTQEDLLSRVSGFSPKKEAQEPQGDPSKFNIKEFNDYLAKIADPQARKLVEDAYKSMQADYTRKTQDLASQKREMDTLKAQLEQSGRYTPDRIQQLLTDPSFVQAAREYEQRNKPASQSGNVSTDLTEEEFSYLTTEQQKSYLQSKQARDLAANAMQQVNQMKLKVESEKEDMHLQGRFKNYDPTVVNQIFDDLMSGKVQATREHLWKVADYEGAVERAYRLGRQDEKQGISAAREASSQVNGFTPKGVDDGAPQKNKGESFNDYWRRLAQATKTTLGKT